MSELVASQKVMRNYLNALLTEEQEAEVNVVAEVKKQQLNQLLATVQPEKPVVVAPVVTPAPAKTEPVRAKVVPETIVAKPVTAAPPKALAPAVTSPQLTAPPPKVPAAAVVKEYRSGRLLFYLLKPGSVFSLLREP